MGKRREPRIKVEFPVKVCGMDSTGHPFVQTAYTVTLSRRGVRLTGLGELVRIGDPVVVIFKGRKARFRVSWIGQPGFAEQGQAGLKAIDPHVDMWEIPLPGESPDHFHESLTLESKSLTTEPSGTADNSEENQERRGAPRFKCRGSAEIFTFGTSFPLRGQVDDISLNGVYVHTFSPLPVGTMAKLVLSVQEFRFEAQCEIRTSHPGVGMGAAFREMTTQNHDMLVELMGRFGPRIPKTAEAGTPSTVAEAPSAILASTVIPAAVKEPAAPTVSQTRPIPSACTHTANVTTTPLAALPIGLVTDPVQCATLGQEIIEWFRENAQLTREQFVEIAQKMK